MTFYLATANGLLSGSFPWSFHSVLQSSLSESATETLWDNGVRGIFSNATLAVYIPTDVTLTTTSVSTATPSFTQSTKTQLSGSTAGTSTGSALPWHTCEIITFRSAQSTRFGRGRWFLPPLATNALNAGGGTILPAAQTALQTAMNGYLTGIRGQIQHVILHRHNTKNNVRTQFSVDVVTAVDIPSTFAVQRRRTDKLVPTRVSCVV